jgi:SAM-dependent methyltransferase
MEQAPTSSKTTGLPVVYAGRFAERVAELPGGCAVLSDWDVLPARLATELERATTLIVLDLFSFPFEAMTPEQWDVPLIVVLPRGHDAGFLEAVFGVPLFKRLTFFDCIAAPEDSRVWEELRRRYRWTEGQRIRVGDERPEEAAAEICALLEAESSVPTFFGGDDSCEALRYWSERGDALAESMPHRTICSVSHGAGFNKAIHRVQWTTLEPQFVAARGARAADIPFDVLEVGAGVGRWATSFDLAKTRFFGVDVSEGMIAAARANFPEASFERLGPDLGLPYEDESFDLVFTVTVMHHNPTPAKRALLSEMWRVTRPGGRLLFLEDFVVGGWSERSTVYPMSVLEFVELLLEATAGQVVLEHVESVRYLHDDMTRGGLLAVTKLGVPRRW